MQKLYGAIHCHTEYSLKDSPIHIKDLCVKAKEMGASYLAITDHGNIAGAVEFMDTCTSVGIEPILGVEAYIDGEFSKRTHLILLARNYKGWQELCEAVTLSNKNAVTIAKNSMPIMTKDILKKCFVSGNVIATTACMNGFIGSILRANELVHKDKNRLEALIQKQVDAGALEYIAKKEQIDKLQEEIDILEKEKKTISELAKTTYKVRLKGCEKLLEMAATDEERESAEKALAAILVEKEQIEEAEKRLPRLRSKLSNLKSKLKNWKEYSQSEANAYAKYLKSKENLDSIKEHKEEELYAKAKEEILWYKGVFGDENFYIEFQYHGLESETYIQPILLKLAKETNTKTVASNDTHILTKDHAHARALLKSLRFEKWEPCSKTDEELYLKSDEELYEALSKVLPKEDAKTAILNIRELCSRCHIEIPETPHAPKFLDDNGKEVADSKQMLKDLAYKGAQELYTKEEFTQEYKDRLDYELGVINSMGYADYFLIVSEFIKWAKEYNPDKNYNVYNVGLGRGSAAGSLVANCLKITNVDPIKYGLLFERFLNKDRVSMPDIDSDFANGVREAVIRHVEERYGADCVSSIRTVTSQKGKGAIRTAARLLYFEKLYQRDETENDTIKKECLKIGDRLSKIIPGKPADITVASYNEQLQTACESEDDKTVVSYAMEIENIAFNFGLHAAGIIIGDGIPLSKLIPLMYNKEKQRWAIQCDMVEAERMKFLKMDFLGLVNLNVITQAIRFIKDNYGVDIDVDKIPFETEVFSEIYTKGNTSRVFQFESEGMKKTLREFKPSCIEDIILLNAAYRPGPMDFIPQIVSNKHGKTKPHYIVPSLEKILAPTYGCPIYQEQLMAIFHDCAGFTLGEADIIRRYMSKKKKDKFLAYKDRFIKGLMAEGASKKDSDEFWDSLVNFANYGFNKSHAAVYSILSYKTAWLKYHYPKEFMCATLNFAKPDDIPFIINECRDMGITILPPDVNKSKQDFTTRHEGILFGFNAVKGLKTDDANQLIKERKENGYYKDFKDFVMRNPIEKASLELLVKAGAFRTLDENSRKDVLDKISHMLAVKKNISKAKEKIESPLKSDRDKEKAKNTLEASISEFNEIWFDTREDEDSDWDSVAEKDILRTYLSSHPLDKYADVLKKRHDGIDSLTLIEGAEQGYGVFVGIITNLKILSDKQMAFFTFEDKTGHIECSCFRECFSKYAGKIRSDAVVKIHAKVTTDNRSNDGTLKLICNKIEDAVTTSSPIFMSVPDYRFFIGVVYPRMKALRNESGEFVIVHSQKSGEIIPLKERFDKSLLSLDISNVYIKRCESGNT